MDLLEVNGTCIGVLKEGVFFNRTYAELRKCLITNFNVREVISIPQDQFENTTTKTSIIIFDNTEEKTSKVKFYDLDIKRYEEDTFKEILGDIYLIENKGDIKNVSDKLISEATKEELLSTSISSLNSKDYNKKEIICGKDYKLVKLGDISEFLSKSKRNASFGQEKGQYNFYTSSDKVQKCDVADYNEESIIIGSGGVANIKIDNIFSCSADNFIIKSSKNKYIYYLIKGNMNLLIDGFTGSTLKHISKEYLKNLEIPIPKSEEKLKEWVDKISKPYDKKIKKEQQLKELEIEIQNKIKYIIENEDCEQVELGSICEIKSGNHTTKKSDFKEGSYLVIGGGINPICSHNEYNCEENTILCASHGTVGLINMYPVKTFLTMCFGLIVKNNDNKMYIYNYLKFINNEIINLGNGSTLKCITKIQLSKIKIKIPKNKELIDNLEPLFNKIEELQTVIKKNEKLYNQFIQELSDETLPKKSNYK
jgi:type I restriction enzyme S subunit